MALTRRLKSDWLVDVADDIVGVAVELAPSICIIFKVHGLIHFITHNCAMGLRENKLHGYTLLEEG